MSTNCFNCVVGKRTGGDGLCDKCRDERRAERTGDEMAQLRRTAEEATKRAEEAEKRAENAEATSEARRKMVVEKADEVNREWARAENAEAERDAARAEVERLTLQRTKDAEDIETMQAALDWLTNPTLGPAVFTRLGEAGMNEVQLRIEYADRARKECHVWKEADIETEALRPAPESSTTDTKEW